MYLLLVDHSLASFSELKEMIEQASGDPDIINCYSQETLLKVAEKISPDIVIIDFELLKEDPAFLFDSLRSKEVKAHIMALIGPEHYDTLLEVIDHDGIDDYMVKPIKKEDLFARVQIAAKKKRRPLKSWEEAPYFDGEEKSGAEEQKDFPGLGFADRPGKFEEESEEDLHDPGADSTGEEKSILQYPGLTEEDLPASGKDGPGLEGDETEIFDDLDLFSDKPDEEDDLESEATKWQPVSGFDDFKPEESDREREQDILSDDFSGETRAPEADLFDDPGKTGQEPDLEERDHQEGDTEELLRLFDDVDSIFDSKEDVSDTPLPGEISMPDKDADKSGAEPGPDVVRPADEFLGKERPPEKEKSTPPLAEDKQFFDDLFDDDLNLKQPGDTGGPGEESYPGPGREEDRESEDFFKSGFPGFEDEEEDLPPGGAQISSEEIRRRSSLPGKSADDFLFGEDKPENPDQDQTAGTEDNEEEEWGPSRKHKKSKGKFRGFFSIFGNILFVILILVMAGLSFFLIQSRITGGVPQVAGYQIYIVLSGSMSPEFDTGSLAFVREKEPEQLVVGDIITFKSPNDPDSLTTHRIVEIQREDGLSFITRGDANNVNDPNPVPEDNVVGIVTGSVPYVGYLLSFVQTTQGLILLIFVPGILIIAFELNKIFKYLSQGNESKKYSRANGYQSPAEEGK